MKKEELAKQYADKKVIRKGQYIDYDFDVRKELTAFSGDDIEQAYEDGFDKAVKLACDFIKNKLPMEYDGLSDYIKDFRKTMMGG